MKYQVNEKTEAYLSRFYEPSITTYEFLKCFFAYLMQKKVEQVDRDLFSFLYEQKQNEDNNDVLSEISFRSNGVNYYSDDVEDALFNLQNGGLLGKMNPSFGIIMIKYTDDEIDEALNSINPKYNLGIERIANNYILKNN